MTLIDLIFSQIKEHRPGATITKLDDDSGQTISIPKRKDGVEYVFLLDFGEEGISLQDVKLYKGDIIETIDHRRFL